MAKKPRATKPKRYLVTDGELVLELEYDEEYGGYCVTSPLNPDIITQGETLEEVFEMARDCAALMAESRKEQPASRRKRAPRRGAR